jgi:hypothetical protein
MTDDLKPHQRPVMPTWVEALDRLIMRDELAEILILTHAELRRAKHIRRIGLTGFERIPATKPATVSPAKAKKAAKRAMVNARRKQKHGGKR